MSLGRYMWEEENKLLKQVMILLGLFNPGGKTEETMSTMSISNRRGPGYDFWALCVQRKGGSFSPFKSRVKYSHTCAHHSTVSIGDYLKSLAFL